MTLFGYQTSDNSFRVWICRFKNHDSYYIHQDQRGHYRLMECNFSNLIGKFLARFYKCNFISKVLFSAFHVWNFFDHEFSIELILEIALMAQKKKKQQSIDFKFRPSIPKSKWHSHFIKYKNSIQFQKFLLLLSHEINFAFLNIKE